MLAHVDGGAFEAAEDDGSEKPRFSDIDALRLDLGRTSLGAGDAGGGDGGGTTTGTGGGVGMSGNDGSGY